MKTHERKVAALAAQLWARECTAVFDVVGIGRDPWHTLPQPKRTEYFRRARALMKELGA